MFTARICVSGNSSRIPVFQSVFHVFFLLRCAIVFLIILLRISIFKIDDACVIIQLNHHLFEITIKSPIEIKSNFIERKQMKS